MTQTVGTPEKEDNQDTHELSESGPMWKKIAQLVGDEELAREVFDQLKDAIQSSAIQNALSTSLAWPRFCWFNRGVRALYAAFEG